MRLRMKSLNIFWFTKNQYREGGLPKRKLRRGCLKRGPGQFANLRDGGMSGKREMVFGRKGG